jgi:hypothetical protein
MRRCWRIKKLPLDMIKHALKTKRRGFRFIFERERIKKAVFASSTPNGNRGERGI